MADRLVSRGGQAARDSGRTAPSHRRDAPPAVVVALMVFSSALGPGFVGWLIDRSVSLDAQFVVMGVYCAAVSVVLLFVGRHVRARSEPAPATA